MPRLRGGDAGADALLGQFALDKANLPALAVRDWPVLHRLGPVFLEAFKLRAVPAAAVTLRSVELLYAIYRDSGRTWPQSLPVSCRVRPGATQC